MIARILPDQTVLSEDDRANDIIETNLFFGIKTPDGNRVIFDRTDGTSYVVNLWRR